MAWHGVCARGRAAMQLWISVFTSLVIALLAVKPASGDESAGPDYVAIHAVNSINNFAGADHYAISLAWALPKGAAPNSKHDYLWPTHFGADAGVLSRNSTAGNTFSIGPRWYWRFGKYKRWHAHAGVAITYLDRTLYPHRHRLPEDFGSRLQFTTHAAIGYFLMERQQLALLLRYQHISNGGLDDQNPGIDMLGLELQLGIGQD